MIMDSNPQVQLKESLKDLFFMSKYDIAYDGNSDYVEARDELLKLFKALREKSIWKFGPKILNYLNKSS